MGKFAKRLKCALEQTLIKALCMGLGLALTCSQAFESVQLKNISNLDDDELWAQMDLRSNFDSLRYSAKRQDLSYAQSSLENLCQLGGYFKCKVQVIEKDQNHFLIEFKSGPQFKISQSKLSFADSTHWDPSLNIPTNLLLELNGGAYDHDKVNELSQEILLEFQNQGYIHSGINQTISIDSVKRQVAMHYQLELRPRVLMGQLRIQILRQGDDKQKGLTLEQSVRPLWKIPPGGAITLNELYSFRRKLLQTGLFNRVDIKDSLRGTYSDIELFCQEKAPGTLATKVFYSYDQVHDLGLGFNASHRNVGGAFHQISNDLILGLRQQRLGLGYAQPLLFGWPLRFDLRPFYEHVKYWDPLQQFNFDKYSFTNRLSLSQTLGQLWSWQISSDMGYRAVDYPADNAALKLDAPEDRRELQIRADPTLSLDWVNDPIDPTLGYRAKATYSNGGAFDQERRFSTGRLSQTLYLPIAPSTSWAATLEVGKFFQGADLIEARSFYQGGFRTLRGYPSFYLQPTFNPTHFSIWDESQQNYRDSVEKMQYSESPTFWRLSQEIRFPIIPDNKQFKAVLFADYAKIWDIHNPRLRSKSAMSVGPGIRFKISLLNLRIDYAWWKDVEHLRLWEGFGLSRLSIDLSQAI